MSAGPDTHWDKAEDINCWGGGSGRTERGHRSEAGRGRWGGYLRKENSMCKGPEVGWGAGVEVGGEGLGPRRTCRDGGLQDWSRKGP